MNAVKVQFQELSNLNIDNIQINQYLADDELTTLSRYHQKKDALAFCVGRVLIRTTLSQILGVKPKEIPLEMSEHGKPFCTLKNAPQFSLSHCESLLGLAWSKTPIGLDIETKNQAFNAEWGELVISEMEERAIQSLPESEQAGERIKRFTLKEAYLKMLGTGFMTDPKKIQLISHNTEIWEAHSPQHMQGKLLLHSQSPDWIIAIAIPNENL